MCSEKVLKPRQTWLLGFSTIHHYTEFGTATYFFISRERSKDVGLYV
jgi:hypothetical protein